MTNNVEINCRGLACPQPVLNTKKALEQMGPGTAVVIVDNETAKENVSLFARNTGHRVEISQEGGEYHIAISKAAITDNSKGPQTEVAGQSKNTAGPEKNITPEAGAKESGCVYFITSNLLGQGSPDLGQVLMKSLMVTLAETDPAPHSLLLLNTGVMLACQGSTVLQLLEKIAGRGADVISCGTCLEYYKLKESLSVGRMGNMFDIHNIMSGPRKVITVS